MKSRQQSGETLFLSGFKDFYVTHCQSNTAPTIKALFDLYVFLLSENALNIKLLC